MPAQLLLIDALNLIRRIFAVDSNQSANDDQLALKNTQQRVLNACTKLIKITQASHAVVVFDGDKSWRYTFYPNYKHSRKPAPQSLTEFLPKIQQALKDIGIPVYCPENDEADDIIATLATKASNNGVSTTIISTDKGFLPLLSDHILIYDYFAKKYMTPELVLEKFSISHDKLYQYWAICGDKTNDIPGVSGIGKQGALNIVNHTQSIDEVPSCDALPASLKQKLASDINNYVISKQLVTLRQDIHLGFSLKDIRLQNAV